MAFDSSSLIDEFCVLESSWLLAGVVRFLPLDGPMLYDTGAGADAGAFDEVG